MAAVSFRSLLWRHCFLTISYCCVFLSFGMGVSFLGPTLLDLGCRTGNVFSTMSWIFFSQTLFILVGSASGGWLASRFPKHRVLLVSVFFMAATLALIPSCTNLAPLVAALAVMGFFMGNIDTIANLSMIQLYGVNVGPFLQALHFFYGLGAFLAPMIVEPFLLNVDCTSFIDPAAHAAFAAVFLFLFDGFQAIYGSYVYSFAVKGVDSIPTSEAAYLNALFWGTFALGRLLSIVISTSVSPQLMLLGNILGCLFGVSFLLAFYRYHSMLYTGTAVIGLFLSSVYPTSLALVENYINVTPPITTFIVVSAAAGEMFLPVIVGHEFGSFGPNSFLVNCLIVTVLGFGVYFCLLIIGNNIIRYTAEPGFFGGLRAVFFSRGHNIDPAEQGSSGERFGPSNVSPGHRINTYARMKSSESSEIDLQGRSSPNQ